MTVASCQAALSGNASLIVTFSSLIFVFELVMQALLLFLLSQLNTTRA